MGIICKGKHASAVEIIYEAQENATFTELKRLHEVIAAAYEIDSMTLVINETDEQPLTHGMYGTLLNTVAMLESALMQHVTVRQRKLTEHALRSVRTLLTTLANDEARTDEQISDTTS